MSYPNLFAQWLRDRRKSLHLTQAELAARTGLSFSAVQKLEGGQRRPSQQVARLLADALQIAPKERAHFLRQAMGSPDDGGERADTPTNLPAQLTPLIGREEALEKVEVLLRSEDVRLVTLTGPPGIGKTRLALQAASTLLPFFPDGVFLVSLAPIQDQALVLGAVAGALGLRDSVSEPLSLTLREYLREQKVLLVLDNFEQVVTAAPSVVGLLWGCPGVKILVTSREPLHVRGEQQFEVDALPFPHTESNLSVEDMMQYPAVALFVERAKSVDHSFRYSANNAGAVATLCARVDGVPLAIELLAAHVKMISPRALVQQFAKASGRVSLNLLSGGARDLPERHRTLRTAISWSFDLLNSDERALFTRLGVFVGGFTLPAVEAVCNADEDLSAPTIDVLKSLLDKSLLKREAGVSDEDDRRYTMLETVREHAIERLEVSSEVQEVRQWHLEYYLALARAVRLQMTGAEQEQGMLKLDRESDNIRAAMRWAIDAGKLEIAAQMGDALAAYWYMRSQAAEGHGWLKEIVHHPQSESLPLALQAKLYSWLGYLVSTQSDLDQNIRYLERSATIRRQLGDDEWLADALHRLGSMEMFRGNYVRAESILRETLELSIKLAQRREGAIASHTLALIALFTGDYQRAISLETEAIHVLREVDDTWHGCLSLGILGLALRRNGHPDLAQDVLQEAIKALEGLASSDHPYGVVLMGLAEVAQDRGDKHLARTLYGDALSKLRETGTFPSIAFALVGFACLLASDGEAEKAVVLFGSLAGAGEKLKATSIVPSNRAEYERALSFTRATLEEARWTWAWSRGRAMSVDAAVAFGLEAANDG